MCKRAESKTVVGGSPIGLEIGVRGSANLHAGVATLVKTIDRGDGHENTG